jgi:predicted aspartyl protease
MEVLIMNVSPRAVSLVLAGFLCASAVYAHPAARQAFPPDNSQPTEIPFTIAGQNMILVDGRIGSLTSLKFAIDTGTTNTVVDADVVRRLAITPKPAQLQTFGQPVPAGFVVMPEVAFGPVRITGHPVVVTDLSYTQTFRARVDAVIGLDLLRLNSFTIDFQTRTMRFGIPPALDSVPIEFCQDHLTIVANVDGHPLHLVLATALNDVLLLPNDSAPFLLPVVKKKDMAWPAANGRFVVAQQVKLDNFRLGQTRIADKAYLLGQQFSALPRAYAGYLGTGVLHARRLHFNFRNNTFAWER